MGVNSVYSVLQEVFPQVDTRILKAVAIEHSKDADSAVEVVLVEIIPHLAKETMDSGSSNDSVEDAHQPSHTEDMLQLGLNETAGTLNDSSYPDANGVVDHLCGYNENCNVKVDLDVTTSHVTSNTMLHESIVDDDCNQVRVNTKNEEITSLLESNSVKVGLDQGSHVSSTTSTDSCNNRSTSGNLLTDWEDFGGVSAPDCSMITDGESRQRQLCSDGSQLEVDNSVGQLSPSTVHECTLDAPEDRLQLEDVHMLNSDYEKRSSVTSYASSKKGISTGEMVDFKDEPALNAVITRSGQICRIDLLEDIIEDARNNKKKLFSAMESIIILMREVELQEKAAERAKEEAVRAGLDILTRVEDLKQMLQHAKEANDMHAGEVYGEKAILATEVRELQSRLLSLSDERDKSLAILDEMRQTLEDRLDASEKERQIAEQEKMEKEESVRNALAEQELIMDKVVQESKILEEEAEENSKLREFLVDRGRIVDMLQGEISVICQDVKLLKEKFDERVPLSKSLSSSQTSCILASSSSSLKSMAPDLVLEQVKSSKTPNKTIPVHSDDEQLPSGVEGETNDHNALVEDGWELFDNREFHM